MYIFIHRHKGHNVGNMKTLCVPRVGYKNRRAVLPAGESIYLHNPVCF